jgi:hypothetical protein
VVAVAVAAIAVAGRTDAVTVLVDVDVDVDVDVAVASGAGSSARAVRDVLATLRHDTGAHGAVLVFETTPDAAAVVDGIAPFVRSGTPHTLRDRLGLARPASRYIRTLEGALS